MCCATIRTAAGYSPSTIPALMIDFWHLSALAHCAHPTRDVGCGSLTDLVAMPCMSPSCAPKRTSARRHSRILIYEYCRERPDRDGAIAEGESQARASARCRFRQVATVESEYQMGAIVTGRPVGRPIISTIGKPREVWPWAMKLLFGSPVFLSYWPLPLK